MGSNKRSKTTVKGQDVKLTDKQEAFILAYLSNGRNATKAAIQAGYSDKQAQAMGYHNLRIDYIKDIIDKETEKDRENYKVSKESLAQEYDDAIKMSKEANNVASLVSAINGKAKLFGFDIQKVEHSGEVSLFDLINKADKKIKQEQDLGDILD